MIILPNGCKCSKISVTPKNWNGAGATTQKDWKIYYRFYDPEFPKPKLVEIKANINYIKNLNQRREVVKRMIDDEEHKLKNLGFNPITRQIETPDEFQYEIDPDTPFVKALELALPKLQVAENTRKGIKGVIAGISKAAAQLRLGSIPVSKVTRRHIKAILEQCGRNANSWSATRYNLYRAYLMMLYVELVELEAVPGNPMRDISKRSVPIKIKIVLSREQRKEITEYLSKEDPRFLNFVQLFFHSGGRKTELLQLKPASVDLKGQKYRCMVKKGKRTREVERTIKTISIPLWEFFLRDCPEDHFIFGRNLMPGIRPMGVDMPSRYWKKYVKDALGIYVDLYSIKHLNTTEVVDALDEKAAAELNAHTSTAMVRSIYDVRQSERQHERLKDVGNEF